MSLWGLTVFNRTQPTCAGMHCGAGPRAPSKDLVSRMQGSRVCSSSLVPCICAGRGRTGGATRVAARGWGRGSPGGREGPPGRSAGPLRLPGPAAHPAAGGDCCAVRGGPGSAVAGTELSSQLGRRADSRAQGQSPDWFPLRNPREEP